MIQTIILYALANRARGTKLSGDADSTTAARLVCVLAMATAMPTLLSAAVLAVGLFLAFLSGWGKYIGAIVNGAIPNESEFAPVDAIMRYMPVENPAIWGAIAMTLRMCLFIPAVGVALYFAHGNMLLAALCPLMGLAYYPFKGMGGRGWALGEYASGAVLGAIISAAV